MTAVLTYLGGCDRCGTLATWRATPDGISHVGTVTVDCPVCDGTNIVESEPPLPALEPLPASTVLARLARNPLHPGRGPCVHGGCGCTEYRAQETA